MRDGETEYRVIRLSVTVAARAVTEQLQDRLLMAVEDAVCPPGSPCRTPEEGDCDLGMISSVVETLGEDGMTQSERQTETWRRAYEERYGTRRAVERERFTPPNPRPRMEDK